MVAVVACLYLAALPPKAPKWLDRIIAGYALQYDETHSALAIFDSKRGFYLVRDVECDGADISLVLTRDRNVVAGNGYFIPGFKPGETAEGRRQVVVKALPNLSTGKGIRIGDAPSLVRTRLGTPREVKHSGSRSQYLDFVYDWKESGRNGGEYIERYTFKAGKLIEISFSIDAGAG